MSSKVLKTMTRIKDDINDLVSDQVYDLSAKQAKISFNIANYVSKTCLFDNDMIEEVFYIVVHGQRAS